MNRLIKLVSVGCCTVLAAGVALAADFQSDLEKRSYALGANLGNTIRQQPLELDPELVARGVAEAMQGKSRLADEEITALVQQLREEARQKQTAERQKLAEENRLRGEAFRAEYARREGARTLPGGILYRVLREGTGEKPTGAEYVFCHYRGTLVDGTEFDASTTDRPATFNLDKVIAGWREAIEEMPVGSKWEIVLPAEKAYGERGKTPAIGPNATLIFEVELVGFE